MPSRSPAFSSPSPTWVLETQRSLVVVLGIDPGQAHCHGGRRNRGRRNRGRRNRGRSLSTNTYEVSILLWILSKFGQWVEDWNRLMRA